MPINPAAAMGRLIPKSIASRQQAGGTPHKKRERPQDLDSDLIAKCKAFLEIKVPATNIVFIDEFNKFMPLFNKSMFEQLSKDEIDSIGKEYNSRFSMQHPIQILTRTPDPNGILYPGSKQRYKLEKTIPAMFRSVSTLNDLGKKVPSLITAFFNASTTPANPFDDRKAGYAKSIGQAIALADKKKGNIEQQRAEFKKGSEALLKGGKKSEPEQKNNQQSDDDSMTGLIEW